MLRPGQGHIEVSEGRLEYSLVIPKVVDLDIVWVLLHEGLGAVSLWRDFPDKLAERCRCAVLSFSRFGYGNSEPCALPRPLHYMEQEAAQVLPQIIESINPNKFILLGHSDGASIAALYAGKNPVDEMLGVVLLAPHFFVEDVSINGIEQARKEFIQGALKQKLLPYHGSNIDTAFWGWNDAWLDPEFRQWDISAVISDIQSPILAIQGRNDEYGTLAQIKSVEQNATSKVSTVILDHCGHAPHLQQSSPTLDAIHRFFSEIRE